MSREQDEQRVHDERENTEREDCKRKREEKNYRPDERVDDAQNDCEYNGTRECNADTRNKIRGDTYGNGCEYPMKNKAHN